MGETVSEAEFDRALAYASAAFGVLKRHKIAPVPQFYELLYTYATGVDPVLNQRLDALFRDVGDSSENLTEALYSQFIEPDIGSRMHDVSDRMHERIGSVHESIDLAMTTAQAYSGSLKSARGDLESDITVAAFRKLADKLALDTRQMQESNRSLEDQLQASREDIALMQQDMDHLRRESQLDPLTKIANRRSFDQGLDEAIIKATASKTPLSLMMIDIDHFKKFNDAYGHQTGDQVLRLVAMTLTSNTKGKDLAARYGGEEFVAIMPSTDLAGAVIAADNIRRAIQSKELVKRSTDEKLGRITASFGVATYQIGETAAVFIERADRCLYSAKHAGRNRVVSETELISLSKSP